MLGWCIGGISFIQLWSKIFLFNINVIIITYHYHHPDFSDTPLAPAFSTEFSMLPPWQFLPKLSRYSTFWEIGKTWS